MQREQSMVREPLQSELKLGTNETITDRTMTIRFPDNTQHMALAGRTGSGKTYAALEMLSVRDMDEMPWVIIDHKRDENIKALPAENSIRMR
jgi:type IV secretory pathway VirB4 component